MECPPIHDVFCVFREVLQKFMKKKIYIDQIFTISFRCRDPIRNVIGVWFMIKVFCLVFQDIFVRFPSCFLYSFPKHIV